MVTTRRRFFSALLLILLLKDQVNGAFTQQIGGATSTSTNHWHASSRNHQPVGAIAGASLFVQGGKQQKQQPSSGRRPVRFEEQFQGKQRSTSSRSPSALNGAADPNGSSNSSSDGPKKYNHLLAILTMPTTSMDRIANEAVLNEALQYTNRKLSIVLQCQGGTAPSLPNLRRYVGEVYSQLWDFSMASDDAIDFNDVVVYPQNLPNAAAENWIYHRPDLDAICSHDSICGWISEGATGRGTQFQFLEGNGVGGLATHVSAVNADRESRNLAPVTALHVDNWPTGASAAQLNEKNVLFVDDDDAIAMGEPTSVKVQEECLLGGARIGDKCLYNCVACGGTFDGLHYGHRKLLTLAVSSVTPVTGKLMVGVTVDEMLQAKQFADYIPPLEERMRGVREFLHRLAPGMKNRIIIEPISDAYGPPGKVPDGKEYDALVLSHETLDNGVKLNEYREETLGFEPLTLLCTRRTEAHGMSSTTLRRLRVLSNKMQEDAMDRV